MKLFIGLTDRWLKYINPLSLDLILNPWWECFFVFNEYLSMANGIVSAGETQSVQITIPISTSSG